MTQRASLWRRLAVVVGGLGALMLLVAEPAQGADHLDSPSVQSDPSADIADLYGWISPDGNSLNLIGTVMPLAGEDAVFGNATQYVFHIDSHPGFGMEAAATTEIVCRFYDGFGVECWALQDGSVAAYVEGDASGAEGIADGDGNLRVFAGPRNDPFFFNADGFGATAETVRGALSTEPVPFDINAEGCPDLDEATATALVDQLRTNAPDAADGAPLNDFDGANVLAIVIQVDLDLVSDASNRTLSTWFSTHASE